MLEEGTKQEREAIHRFSLKLNESLRGATFDEAMNALFSVATAAAVLNGVSKSELVSALEAAYETTVSANN